MKGTAARAAAEVPMGPALLSRQPTALSRPDSGGCTEAAPCQDAPSEAVNPVPIEVPPAGLQPPVARKSWVHNLAQEPLSVAAGAGSPELQAANIMLRSGCNAQTGSELQSPQPAAAEPAAAAGEPALPLPAARKSWKHQEAAPGNCSSEPPAALAGQRSDRQSAQPHGTEIARGNSSAKPPLAAPLRPRTRLQRVQPRQTAAAAAAGLSSVPPAPKPGRKRAQSRQPEPRPAAGRAAAVAPAAAPSSTARARGPPVAGLSELIVAGRAAAAARAPAPGAPPLTGLAALIAKKKAVAEARGASTALGPVPQGVRGNRGDRCFLGVQGYSIRDFPEIGRAILAAMNPSRFPAPRAEQRVRK